MPSGSSGQLQPLGMTPELQKRIAAQREKEQTIALSKKKKKKVADEKEFAELIEECRATKNRRKMVVCLERVLDDEENELCEESPLVVKARLLIDELTAHYELVEELQKREKAVEVLTKRERGEITRAFEAFEHEDKGFVLAVALKPVLAALGINIRNREVKRLLATVDKDGLATLNLSEIMLFAAPLVKHRHARMEIMRRYKAFNENPVVDKFGKPVPKGISFRNLAKLSDEVGRHDDLEFLQKLIDVADMDNDGRVTAQEFWVYMKNFASLEQIRAEEKRKAIEIAKAKRVAAAKRDLETALNVARKDMDAAKLRDALMEALNKGLPSDLPDVVEAKAYIADLDELAKYELPEEARDETAQGAGKENVTE
eukprot:INCI1134.1.p1 GENE.INCI1134.1~~INCI1134.1.p1  ORF type:complete len:372 (+),score=95.04 INCI1134.1:168-1283(+)